MKPWQTEKEYTYDNKDYVFWSFEQILPGEFVLSVNHQNRAEGLRLTKSYHLESLIAAMQEALNILQRKEQGIK